MQNPGNSSKSNVKSTIAAVLVLYLFFPAAVTKGDWESDANARIEQIRKRDVQITAVDPNGSPVYDLNMQIDQIYHRFGFGAALAYGQLTDTDYQDFVLDHFEWAVCENEMKWGSNESTRDSENYYQADYIANWCANNGIILRGHCILWEQNNSQMPSWVPGLSCSTYPPTSEMMDEIDERINSIVGRYAGQIVSWDVDNEMLSDNTFGCLGEAGRAHFFQLANSIDPNCGFYMNEYSGNSFGGYDGDAYASRANGLIALGAPVEGLGIQAHVASPFQPENYYNNVLQELAVVGVPIIATEFDTDAGTEAQAADDLEDFYRVCFSHPLVEGIMMWGIEQSAWRWSGIVNSSTWVLNQAGIRYEALLDEWTTEDSNVTDLSGNVNFRGFHGTYEITLSAPGEPAEIYVIELEPGETAAEIVFETNLESPEPDFNSPDPDPMIWASEPTAIGSSRITMTATTATDERPPVEYYFECITDGDANSGWQTDETYIAHGLNPSTLYTFRVKARDSAPVRNETDWSMEESATTEPPGTEVEIIGNWLEGLSHAEETRTNRALIFIAHAEDGGSINLNSVTYGGQPMTKVIERIVSSGNPAYYAYVVAYILDEAGIAAATSNAFVPGWSTTPDNFAYASVFLQNVNQTAPIGNNDSNSVTSYNTLSTTALFTDDGDMVIDAATCGNTGNYTTDNDFNEAIEHDMDSSTGVDGYKAAIGEYEIPCVTHNNVNRQVLIGFVVQAANVPAYQNCAEVQAAGFSLLPDLDGDCYVDYRDFEIIAYYWLNTACDELENCEGADFVPRDGVVDFFDYSDFAMGWLQCNDPEDPNCTPNWGS